jgi:hypothetical protein
MVAADQSHGDRQGRGHEPGDGRDHADQVQRHRPVETDQPETTDRATRERLERRLQVPAIRQEQECEWHREETDRFDRDGNARRAAAPPREPAGEIGDAEGDGRGHGRQR